MPQKKKKAIYVSKLRQRAEEVLEASSGDNDYPVIFSSDEMKTLIHDFQVHQIELEMQNDELRRSQEELDTARARYFDFFNMAPVGFFSVDEQNRILECNFTAARLLKRSQNEFVKQPITRFIMKEDQDIYYMHSKQVFETRMPQECDLRMLKNDGSILWVHLATTTVQNAECDIVCRIVMSNITERMTTEEALQKAHDELELKVKQRTLELHNELQERKKVDEGLRERETHLNTVLNTIPDLVWLKDQDGVYLSCNPKFERFFGAKESDIVGKMDYDFVDKELADFFREKDQAVMDAGIPIINEEEVTYADDGHRELLETLKTPMYDFRGRFMGTVEFISRI